MRWRLAVGRATMQRLRQAGPEVGIALQAMAKEPEPWRDDLAVSSKPGRYERNSVGQWIGYEVDREGKTLRIIYIQPNT